MPAVAANNSVQGDDGICFVFLLSGQPTPVAGAAGVALTDVSPPRLSALTAELIFSERSNAAVHGHIIKKKHVRGASFVHRSGIEVGAECGKMYSNVGRVVRVWGGECRLPARQMQESISSPLVGPVLDWVGLTLDSKQKTCSADPKLLALGSLDHSSECNS